MKIIQRLEKATLLSIAAIAIQSGTPQPASSQSERAFLWEIETPTNTVYLLGSIHYLRPTDYPLSPAVQAAFEDAENLVFEVHPAELTDPTVAGAFLRGAVPDRGDETLQIALSPETYALASEAALEVGLPIEPFNQFEPWFLAVTLSARKLAQLGFTPESGVELYLYDEALFAGKGISGLETVEEQLGFLDDLSASAQQDFVTQTVLTLDLWEASLDTLVDLWKAGDVEQFESFTLASFGDSSEFQDKLLTQRNLNWLPQIEALLDRPEDYLVVVGSAHLVTDNGLVRLLEQKGYSVRQR
ncbi:TraB/GumN family protein [Synechococcus sp. PCC 7336]|uniref:TraB/GumN family protein n=1 Tax=Synechococcus sp. PCC 7336 TaxID=195250 RepID=UPI00034ABBF7|nr:TraB/GumN family protein [Synechococcus sp. PCC 7336]